MQSTTDSRDARRRAILALVGANAIKSQADLGRRLAREGLRATQATLSRDLAELGLRKGPLGYELPTDAEEDPSPAAALARQARSFLLSIETVRNQLVLKTPPGGAQTLALAIDTSGLPGLLGTIAGDDTILLIAAGDREARRVRKELQGLSRRQ